jgi:hypothetical protein
MYEAVGGAIGAFAGAAASGQVSIDADTAADALTEIANIRAELGALLSSASTGAGQVQLGANPVGEAMATKSMSRYDGGDSFLAVVELLLAETEKAERALRQSIDNYVDTDGGHAAKYRGSQG